MKKRLLLLAVPFTMAIAACAPGAGAADPAPNASNDSETPTLVATSRPSVSDRLNTAPRPASAATPTAISQPTRVASPVEPAATVGTVPGPASPVETTAPRPTVVRQPTATPVPFDPFATPTPLWITPPRLVPTATSTPVPLNTPVPVTIVSAAPEDQFQPSLNYQYELASGWSEARTESSIILHDRSGKITVTIDEIVTEPWQYPTAVAHGIQLEPARPEGWDSWVKLSESSIRADEAYEHQYTGVKNGIEYRNFIQWFMWGDIRVQVSAEIPTFDWDFSSTVRGSLQRVLESFETHDGARFFTESDVLTVLAQRLDDRPSGVYARDEVVRARYELTCRQIFTDLIQAPVHLGDGIWQASANTLQGIETWRVFEPGGSFISFDSNNSRC